MNKRFVFFFFISAVMQLAAQTDHATYTAVIEGFDWGPGVNKVILPAGTMTANLQEQVYTVLVRR